jgi:endonuclease-8
MPEGDTVFKLAGYLRPQLGGRRLVAGKVRGMPETTLAGRCIDDVYARGKHLFIEFDQSWLLRSHLGMRGSWHAYAAGEPWQKPPRQASIVLDIGERLFVCFNALEVEFLRNTGVRRRAFDAALGPDLLGDRLDIETILRRARELGDPDMPVADVLLSQRIASGIGNVYKSEVLFLEACHPATPLARMADAQLAALYRQASRLLRRNRHGGPRVTRWVNDAAGRPHPLREARFKAAFDLLVSSLSVRPGANDTGFTRSLAGKPALKGAAADSARGRVPPPGAVLFCVLEAIPFQRADLVQRISVL